MGNRKVLLYIGILALLSATHPGVAVAGTNLIENSSFEGGIDYRFAIGRWYVDGLPNLSLDPATKVHGAVSLKIPLSRVAYRPNTDFSRDIVFRGAIPVLVEAGKTYAFTLYAKADDRAEGMMSVDGYDPAVSKVRTIGRYSFLTTRQWQRKGFIFRPKASGRIDWRIQFRARRPMHVWLDALQIEQGLITDYHPARPVEGGLTTSVPGHIMTSGKEPPFVVRVFNNGNRDRKLDARVDIYNLVGMRVGRVTANLTVKSASGIRKLVALPPLKNGVYRASLFLDEKRSPESELSFSVLPKPRPVEPESSAFGTYLTVAPEPLTIMRRVGAPWIANLTSNGRMIYWNFVEPKEGQFRWYDADVERASRMGFRFMFNLEPCRIPKWAEKLSKSQQREKWVNYVSAMAKHYRKTVKYWTIADEVHGSGRCWSSPADYALWHKAGAEAIKRQVPDAKVIFNTYATVAAAVFAKMDPKFVDILATNFLHLPGGNLAAMTEVGRKHGITEFWAPGVGFGSRSFYLRYWSEKQRTSYPDVPHYWENTDDILVKSIIRTFAYGYKRIFHYTATYVGNTNTFSLFESDSALKPDGAQFAALIWLIDGFKEARSIATRFKATSLHIFRFDRTDGRTAFILWDAAGGLQKILLKNFSASNVDQYDQYANRIGPTKTIDPVILNVGRAPLFVMLPALQANAFQRSLIAAPIVRNTLPNAERVERKGAYALIRGINDGQERRAPNVSFWYESSRYGWQEIFRGESSSFAPEYKLDQDGLTITWNIPNTAANFYLKAGAIPIDLAEGGRFWHSKLGKNSLEWRGGTIKKSQIVPESRPKMRPKSHEFRGYLNYMIQLSNHHSLVMETRVENANGKEISRNVNFGGWGLYSGKNLIVFTQPYGKNQRVRRARVRVRIVNN